MAASDFPSHSMVAALNAICDRFERDLQSEQDPQIEDFLNSDTVDHSTLLKQLLLLEWSYCALQDRAIDCESYEERFSDQRELVRDAWRLHRAQPHETIDWSQDGTDRSDDGAPAQSLPLDQRFGPYEVIKLLGRGAFGSVYLARDPSLDRLVALKIPRATSTQEEGELGRLLDEARVVAKLRHTNIVSVFEVGEVEGVFYVATDYIAGQTLRQMLSDNKLQPDDAASLARSLAEALEHAHREGITHRDVKPENVLIDTQSDPHLADFGLASTRNSDPDRTGILGTPAYMSPEQAKGTSHLADGRSDQWSLGVILYEMLTGRRPFRGEMDELLDAIRKEEAIDPRAIDKTIPRDLSSICLKCLEKEPGERYESCEAVASDLQAFVERRPVKARPVGPWGQLTRWTTRQPIVATLFLVLIVVGIGAVWTTWREAARQRDSEATYNEVIQAVERGDWNRVLVLGQQAIDDGHPKERELRIFLLNAHRSLHNPEELQKGLEQIRLRADVVKSPVLRSEVQLLDAEEALMKGDDRRFSFLSNKIERSALSSAKAYYLQGLNAPTAPQAVDLFRKAIAASPSFDRAWFYMCSELTFLGRREEARAACNEAHGRFPGDPGFIWLLGFINKLENKQEAAAENLEWLEKNTNARYLKTAKLTYSLVDQLRNILNAEKGIAPQQLTLILLKASQLQGEGPLQQTPFNDRLRLSFPPRLKNEFRGVMKAVFASSNPIARITSSIGLPNKAKIELDKLTDSRPEATLFALKGVLLFKMKDYENAEVAFREAMERPSMFPELSQSARALALATAITRASGDKVDKAPHWLRAARYGKELTPQQLDALSVESCYNISGAAFMSQDFNLARTAATRAVQKRPNFTPALEVLMKTEDRVGNKNASLRYAEKILELPDSAPGAPSIKRNARALRVQLTQPKKEEDKKKEMKE